MTPPAITVRTRGEAILLAPMLRTTRASANHAKRVNITTSTIATNRDMDGVCDEMKASVKIGTSGVRGGISCLKIRLGAAKAPPLGTAEAFAAVPPTKNDFGRSGAYELSNRATMPSAGEKRKLAGAPEDNALVVHTPQQLPAPLDGGDEGGQSGTPLVSPSASEPGGDYLGLLRVGSAASSDSGGPFDEGQTPPGKMKPIGGPPSLTVDTSVFEMPALVVPKTPANMRSLQRTEMHAMVCAGDLAGTMVLLAAGHRVDAQKEHGFTPLHNAAALPNAESRAALVAALIAHGADVRRPDNEGYAPLHWAAACGHDDVVTLLLAAGAKVRGRPRVTCVMVAVAPCDPCDPCDGGCGPVVWGGCNRTVTRGGNRLARPTCSPTPPQVSDASETGETALHRASRFARTESIKALLAGGACAVRRPPARLPPPAAVHMWEPAAAHVLGTATRWSPPPHALQAATACAEACNRMRRELQPCALRPATVCA